MMIGKIGIIGAGTMGQGLAKAAASRDIDVFLFDVDQERIDSGMEMIEKYLDARIQKWGLTESEKKSILSRITCFTNLRRTREVDLVIEAIPENMAMKKELFSELERTCAPEMVFVTNTSTLSITEMASDLFEPSRVVGMHFLNPVPRVPLVEIVRGLKTSDSAYSIAKTFADQLKKTAVEVYEYPGYITTRMIVPLINEAMHILMEGVAKAEDIDTAMKLGYDFSVGPLAMADRMGLDQLLEWMETLFRDLGDLKYRPSAMLRKKVRAGLLGVKTGEGFYVYDENGKITGTSTKF